MAKYLEKYTLSDLQLKKTILKNKLRDILNNFDEKKYNKRE